MHKKNISLKRSPKAIATRLEMRELVICPFPKIGKNHAVSTKKSKQAEIWTQ